MELALSAILSAMVGMFLFMGLNSLGYGMLDRMLFREDVILAKEQGCIDSLQEYVTKNSLSSGDSNMLDQWAKTQKNLLITDVYKRQAHRLPWGPETISPWNWIWKIPAVTRI